VTYDALTLCYKLVSFLHWFFIGYDACRQLNMQWRHYRGGPPRVIPSGGDTWIKLFLWLIFFFKIQPQKVFLSGVTPWKVSPGVVRRWQLIKVITLHRRWLKRLSVFLEEKNRVTPSVSAPGDSNPSDATVNISTHTRVAGVVVHAISAAESSLMRGSLWSDASRLRLPTS